MRTGLPGSSLPARGAADTYQDAVGAAPRREEVPTVSATTITTEAPAALRSRVELWFEQCGVPQFSERYPRRDLAPLVLSILVVVLAFEVTALAWLELTPTVALVALVYVAAVLVLLLPFLRALWEPWSADWSEVLVSLVARGTVLLAGGLALSALISLPSVAWRSWVNFALFVILLFAAIVLGRGRHRPEVIKLGLFRMLTAAACVLVLFFALDGWSVVPGPWPPLAVLPAAIVFLVVALATTAPPADEDGDEPSVTGLLPIVLVVLAVQLTILPWASTPVAFDFVATTATAALAWYWPAISRSAPGRYARGALRRRRRLVAPRSSWSSSAACRCSSRSTS
jgi:hypothetical protein